MTIQSESVKAGPFDGNDSTTVFPFTFKVFQAADLDVIFTDTSAVESTLVLDTDYSVSLNADQEASPGGSVTYPLAGDPLATGEKLTVLNGVEFTQGTDLQNGGAWNPETVENAIDRLTMLVQRNQEELGRSVKVDVSSDVTPDDLLDAIIAAAAAAVAAAAAAATSEANASTSEGNAAASESAAAASEAAAAASESAADASESAAAASEAAAAVSAAAALVSENNASTSETNAAASEAAAAASESAAAASESAAAASESAAAASAAAALVSENAAAASAATAAAAAAVGQGIYNGLCLINQRATLTLDAGASAVADGVWYLDRHETVLAGVTGTGQVLSTSQPTGLNGYSLKYAATSSASGQIGSGQAIERFEDYAGKEITYSRWVKSDSADARIIIDDGVTKTAAAHTGGGAWELLTVTATINASPTKLECYAVIASAALANVSITSGEYIEFTGARLDIGGLRLSGEREYGIEFALCERLYQKLTTRVESSTQQGSIIIFHTEMRTTPSVSGGGAGFTSTSINSDGWTGYQTTGAHIPLAFNAEIALT